MSSRTARALLSFVLVPFLLADGPPVAARPAQRSALVTVIAETGTPLRKLSAADFVVKESGKKVDVADAKLAEDPLSIAFLIEMSAPPVGGARPVQDLRNAATAFVKAIHAVNPDAQIALVPFAGAVVTSVDFTHEPADLAGAITKLFPNQQTIAVQLEAMLDGAKKLAERPAPRRAMVTVDFNSPEGSTDRMVQQTADAITNSGATLWAASVRGTAATSTNREEVLNKMTKATGGKRFSSIDGTGLEGMLTTIAACLTSQYVVTFTTKGDGPPKSITFETADGKKVFLTPFMR